MNIFQWVLSKFGRQYVFLIHHDGTRRVRPAFNYLTGWYSAPYLWYTATRLLPSGKTRGAVYVEGWEPLTEGLLDLYNQGFNEDG